MERFRDVGVVLGSVDYGEADRVVTLFTQEHGKLTAFAGGARKSRRRFAGALEPLTVLSVDLVERRGSTFRLDAAEIRESHPRIREDLHCISRALYALELVRELTREHEPQPQAQAQFLEQARRTAAMPALLHHRLTMFEVQRSSTK